MTDWPDPWAGFDAVKTAYWGTLAQRSHPDATNILAAKRKAYRYCIFAQRYLSIDELGNPTWKSSGRAELPGNDFMVTLGDPSWTTDLSTDEFRDAQASTFMHELGHTLGLRHGGNDDLHNKPDYYGIMNYTWQIRLPESQLSASSVLQGYRDSWRLDYSREVLPTLNEAALVEIAGIGGGALLSVLVGPRTFPVADRVVPMGGALD